MRYQQTDRPTDRPTDTAYYRDARTHLEITVIPGISNLLHTFKSYVNNYKLRYYHGNKTKTFPLFTEKQQNYG